MDRLLLVSADGHAMMPEALWPAVPGARVPRAPAPARRREPALHRRDAAAERLRPTSTAGRRRAATTTSSTPRASTGRGQWAGAWDLDIRLAEMDHEGVAAEFVFLGYFRATDLFYNVSNTQYPHDVIEAGVRAYDRWLFDTFGSATDRLLLCGAVGAASTST